MSENEHRKWDIIVKILTILSVVLTGIWGIIQYRDTSRRDAQVRLEIAEREYRKVLWEQQVQAYFELSRAAAALIENAPASEPQRRQKFFELLIGPIQVFASERVSKSSNRLLECFKTPCQADDMSMRIMFLSADLRGALKEGWNTTMSQMQGGVQDSGPPPDEVPKSPPSH